jgi:hypothetical protein
MPEDTGIQKGAKGVTSTAGNLVCLTAVPALTGSNIL